MFFYSHAVWTSGQEVLILSEVQIYALRRKLQSGVRRTHGSRSAELIDAIAYRRPDDVRRALRSGADPNAADSNGITPLGFAASLNEDGITSILLSFGANPNPNGANIDIPLQVVANHPVSIPQAAASDIKVAEVLLKHHSKVNAQDSRGATALMFAAKWGNVAMVKLLIKNGAKVNLRDNQGRSALRIARSIPISEVDKRNLDATVKVLKGAGATE